MKFVIKSLLTIMAWVTMWIVADWINVELDDRMWSAQWAREVFICAFSFTIGVFTWGDL